MKAISSLYLFLNNLVALYIPKQIITYYIIHSTLGQHIGVGRFRILGGQGLEYRGAKAYDVVMTSMRRNDVTLTSFRRHVPTRFLINQCQIITFLILKSDIIENSRIELRGIVLPVPSNQIKVTFIIILPFNLVHS